MFIRTYRSYSRLFVPVLAALMLVTSSSAQAYVTRGTTRTNVNTANVNRNVNINTANVNRNVNVNTANVNVSGGCCYSHVGVGGAVAAGVVVGATAAVVGSAIAASALPPSCSLVLVNGLTYQNCGGAWYQPQYSGPQVTYIVVNPPK
jgi:hypothetical protein